MRGSTVLIFCLFTDQLFTGTGTGTGTGYCSERSDTFGEATALLSVHCSSRSTWLANSTTFGRVPVSAVNGMVRRVCPMVTTEKLNALALPALLYRHPTGVYVLLFISSGTSFYNEPTFRNTFGKNYHIQEIEKLQQRRQQQTVQKLAACDREVKLLAIGRCSANHDVTPPRQIILIIKYLLLTGSHR
ncbi:hypothetical protein J6590_043776 [Homalodisca vitripennis]|nr:hypothetical protein J6590_043776 [Homalodisca vitripennis]